MIYKEPYVIAEAGCNHMGNMDIAHELIVTAAMFCKADAIKFQKRCPKELLTKEQYAAPHPVPYNSYGDTYGAQGNILSLTLTSTGSLRNGANRRGSHIRHRFGI